MKGLVSIIIPTYNAEKFILQTLESVKNQIYKNFEIIIVDDCSSDNTVETVRNYLSSNNLRGLVIQCDTNHGAPAGPKNIGIKQSNGEFIAFLDHDDLWTPDKLKVVVDDFINHPDNQAVFTDLYIKTIKGVKKITYWDFISKARHYKKDEIQSYFKSTLENVPVLTSSAAVVKKEVFNKIGFFDEELKISDDFDMWIRIMNAFEVYFEFKPVVYWNSHSSNLSKKGEKIHLDNIKFANKRKFLNDTSWMSNESLSAYIRTQEIRLANYYVSQKRINEALTIYKKVLEQQKNWKVSLIKSLCQILPSFTSSIIKIKKNLSESLTR